MSRPRDTIVDLEIRACGDTLVGAIKSAVKACEVLTSERNIDVAVLRGQSSECSAEPPEGGWRIWWDVRDRRRKGGEE